MKLEVSRQVFVKSSSIRFHQNPFSGSQVVAFGRTDMTKLIVAFRNFANAPKKNDNVFLKCKSSATAPWERQVPVTFLPRPLSSCHNFFPYIVKSIQLVLQAFMIVFTWRYRECPVHDGSNCIHQTLWASGDQFIEKKQCPTPLSVCYVFVS
jgi:hypothetical protein